MQIELNKVVSFHYHLSDVDGVTLEDSRHGEPMAYLHGHGSIIPGLEAAMQGKQKGDEFSVTLTPEQGYGSYREEAKQRISNKYFDHPKTLKPGTLAAIKTKQGDSQWATVLKVGKFNVDVDTNHPLAGKTLVFAVEILDVRDASLQEISHGHAHGPSSHQH